MKYRKKQVLVIVDAGQFIVKKYERWCEQYKESNFLDICFKGKYKTEEDEFYHQIVKMSDSEYRIETVVSDPILLNGDFIIKSKEGLFYRLTEKVFHNVYEEVK